MNTAMEIGQALLQAPFGDMAGWEAPLRRFAEQTGSCQAQIIGTSHTAQGRDALLFHCLTDPRPGADHDAFAIGAVSADVNWKMGMRSAPLEIVSEAKYAELDPARDKRNLFTQYLQDYKGYYGFHATLIDDGDVNVTIAALRGHATGGDALEMFRAILPYAHSAAMLQRSLESRGFAMAAETFDTLDIAIMLLDRTGQVQTLTRSADRILAGGGFLDMSRNRVRAAQPAYDKYLQAALRAAQSGHPCQKMILRRNAAVNDALIVEVFALPRREWSFGFEPRVLLTLKAPQTMRAVDGQLLADFFQLTTAESDIAQRLAQGFSRKDIAQQRNASEETVATQVKSIFRKAEVSREGAFIALARNLSSY